MNKKNALKKFNNEHPIILGFDLYEDGRFALLEPKFNDKNKNLITENDVLWTLYNSDLAKFPSRVIESFDMQYYPEYKLLFLGYNELVFTPSTYGYFRYMMKMPKDNESYMGVEALDSHPIYYAKTHMPFIVQMNGKPKAYDIESGNLVNLQERNSYDGGWQVRFNDTIFKYKKIDRLNIAFDGARTMFVNDYNDQKLQSPTTEYVRKLGFKIEKTAGLYYAALSSRGEFTIKKR